MDYIEPKPCCTETWKKLDIWDNDDLPDQLVCPECGNIGVFVPWQKETGILGIHVEGTHIKWYPPSQEVVM